MDHNPTPEESRKFCLFMSALLAICSLAIVIGFYLMDGFVPWGILLVFTLAFIAMGIIFFVELPRRPDKPTLGGLRKAREFLYLRWIDLPEFEHSLTYDVGKDYYGKSASLDELIDIHGPLHEMHDVRLMSNEGQHFAMFVFADVVTFDGKTQWQISTEDRRTVDNLARYGMRKPSWRDRMRFSYFPHQYAAEVF